MEGDETFEKQRSAACEQCNTLLDALLPYYRYVVLLYMGWSYIHINYIIFSVCIVYISYAVFMTKTSVYPRLC